VRCVITFRIIRKCPRVYAGTYCRAPSLVGIDFIVTSIKIKPAKLPSDDTVARNTRAVKLPRRKVYFANTPLRNYVLYLVKNITCKPLIVFEWTSLFTDELPANFADGDCRWERSKISLNLGISWGRINLERKRIFLLRLKVSYNYKRELRIIYIF